MTFLDPSVARKYHRDYRRKRRLEALAEGRCTHCYKGIPQKGKRLCFDCLLVHAAHSQKRRTRKKRQLLQVIVDGGNFLSAAPHRGEGETSI